MTDVLEERANEYDMQTKNKTTERVIVLKSERETVKSYLNKVHDVLDGLYELFRMCNFYD